MSNPFDLASLAAIIGSLKKNMDILAVSLQNSMGGAPVVQVDQGAANSSAKDPLIQNQSEVLTFPSSEILVKLTPSAKDLVHSSNPKPDQVGIASLNALNRAHGVIKFEQVTRRNGTADIFRWYKLTLGNTKKIFSYQEKSADALDFERVVNEYKSNNNIEAAEPNYILSASIIPNDPYYSSTGSWGQTYDDLWGMKKINASAAWDVTTGSSSIVVADIDTGMDRTHPELAANVWTNSGEIPNNGVDDDGNGYVDDYYGWDWVNNDNDPTDDHGHGTHTIGTIAATGNDGIGVTGVTWTSRIMALKFLDSAGSGYLDNGIKALQYAADMGARVSSNSWGGAGTSVAMDDAIQYEHDKGMVTVVAAGNSNADALGSNPASADGAITVSASDWNDAKASFSNWGGKIDVAAPGVEILSTRAAVNTMCTSARTVGTDYCHVSGTSMATPHVAGLAALILAKNPNLTNEEVRQILRVSAADLGVPGKDSDFGYGRISASGAVALANTHPLTPIISSPHSRTIPLPLRFAKPSLQ